MDPWIAKMVRQVQVTPPSCLAGFQVTPAHPEPWKDYVVWSLKCSCGSEMGKLLGHSLKDLHPQYDGPELFASPLGFSCSSCGKITEIIDTKLHGYNAEVGKLEGGIGDANIRGTGERRAFECPHCKGTEFAMQTLCAHSHFDLMDDEPELEPRAQDFFDSFSCGGTCASCGEQSTFAIYELA